MSATWENIKVGDSTMRAYVAVPDASAPAGGVVVVQGQTGVNDVTEFSRLAASEGFVAVAPDLYHRDPADCQDDWPTRRLRLTGDMVIADINAAAGYLKSHPAMTGKRLGIVGFCMGGRAVYLMASVNPDIKAGVMYYGGDTFEPWGASGQVPFERSKDIHCPIMGHFGVDDKNPSPADMRKLDAELTNLGKAHEFFSYENAAHAFANFGSPGYREHAAKASWPRTFGFFRKQLQAA